jgi:hypothetical protein
MSLASPLPEAVLPGEARRGEKREGYYYQQLQHGGVLLGFKKRDL